MGLMYQDGWSYSAEDAWYEPPEYEDEEVEAPEPTVRDVILKLNERNNRMKLYEISAEYAAFIEAFDNGDIPEEAFADTLDGIHGVFEDKCVAVACSIKNDGAMIDALSSEIERLSKRKMQLERACESKRRYLMSSMDSVGVDKIKGDPRAQLSIKKNPPKVVFSDKAAFLYQAINEGWTNYLTTPQPSLNLNAVKNDVKNGVSLPGVHLEQDRRVDIS